MNKCMYACMYVRIDKLYLYVILLLVLFMYVCMYE